jgi:hypothetical protein
MTEITGEALSIAGFVLAQAVTSVCNFKAGELLTPLAIVEFPDGTRRMTLYEAATQAEAIARAKAEYTINSATNDAWAVAREDSYQSADEAKAHEVIAVDFWSKGMPYVASLVQRFERGVGRRRAHLDGLPSIIDDGKMLDPAEGALMVDRVRQGVSEHPEAERLWRYWE